MLSRLGLNVPQAVRDSEMSREISPHERNEKDDMKKGIEYLYEFKEKLSQLHPNVLYAIEHMLQRHNCY